MGNFSSTRASAILLVGIIIVLPARAKYMAPDLINVPVERLVKNLEALANEKPNDAEVRLNLARVHAMAYALKTDTADVWKGRENQGAWFGYTPANVPFEVKPSDDKNRLATARQHLAKAIERYEETLKLDPGNLTAALGHAWCIEQSRDKKRAITEYRKVIQAAWAKEKDLGHAGLGWHSITAEAAGYLIPLLDKEKRRREIIILQRRVAKLERVQRPVTPLVIPLRDGLTLSQLADRY